MRPVKNLIVLLLAAWVLLIGYSRIYLGVHYPLDVLAGCAYGAAAAFLMHRIYLKFEIREYTQ